MHSETRKRVLVTAAGSGIGLAIARAFVRQGAAVAICDISESNLSSAISAIPEAPGWVTDVADHKLARIIYHLLTARAEYDPVFSAVQAQERRRRIQRRLRKQAHPLGFKLVPETV